MSKFKIMPQNCFTKQKNYWATFKSCLCCVPFSQSNDRTHILLCSTANQMSELANQLVRSNKIENHANFLSKIAHISHTRQKARCLNSGLCRKPPSLWKRIIITFCHIFFVVLEPSIYQLLVTPWSISIRIPISWFPITLWPPMSKTFTHYMKS